MAKFNIPFDGVDYLIDESALTAATTALQSHFSTALNGSGETITLNGISYNVDATKLSVAKNDFVSHLGTIAGNGSKVKVNGVEYPVDTAKVSDATAELHAVLGGMISGGGEEEDTIAAGLYETGSNYTVLLKSWADLLAEGLVKVDNNAVSVGTILPDDLPEKNEYGFYYGVAYTMSTSGEDIVFKEDTSFDVYSFGELIAEIPAGAIIYNDGSIDMSSFNFGIGTVSADGATIVFDAGLILTLGTPASLGGDLLLPNDGTIKAIDSFANNTELTGVVIPDSVTTIDNYAFANCWSLVNVTFEGTVAQWNAITKGEGWNDGSPIACVQCSDGTIQYTVPGLYETGTDNMIMSWNGLMNNGILSYDGMINSGQEANLAGDLVLPDGMTTIGEYAFSDCTALTSIEIPASVTTIGSGAFSWCTALTSIEIPDGVTSIGERAFYNCENLKTVDISENSQLTAIGQNTFYQCKALTSIAIPDSVTTIDYSAFEYCYSLESVTFGANSQLTTIGYRSFSCTNLTSIEIPDGVTSIGDDAFNSCEKLTSVTIPDSVTVINKQAFIWCTNLKTVNISKNSQLTTIWESVFFDCKALESITLPDSLTKISPKVFSGCVALTSIEIPASITDIAFNVFKNCTSLNTITFKGTMAQWNAITKGSNWNSNVPATYVQCSDGTVQL